MRGNMDLANLMSCWLVNSIWNIILMKAFRLRVKMKKQNDGTKDIIVIWLNQRWKQRILYEAWQWKVFQFKSAKVHIFPYLPKEALQCCYDLKPITHTLNTNDIRYRWVTPLKIMVRCQGKTLTASDEKSGQCFSKPWNLRPRGMRKW